LYISNNNLFALIDKSFDIIPNPVHGASNKTLSNVPGNISGYLRPSLQVTAVFVTPKRYKLNCKALKRYFLRSFAKIQPVFFIS
jgi:hypothetical protein